MATSEGEVSKGKLAIAYLLKKEIDEKMPGVVGEFLNEVVDARIGGNPAPPVTSPAVVVAAPLEITAPTPSRMIEASPPQSPSEPGGKPPSRVGRKMSEETKRKIKATRAANKAARSRPSG